MLTVYWLAVCVSLAGLIYVCLRSPNSAVLALYTFAFFSSFALPWHLTGLDEGPVIFRTAVFVGALVFVVAQQRALGQGQLLCIVGLLCFSILWCVWGLKGVLAGADGGKTLAFFYRVFLPMSVLILAWPLKQRDVVAVAIGSAAGALLLSLYVAAYGGLTFSGRAYIVGGTAETISIGRVIGLGVIVLISSIYALQGVRVLNRVSWLSAPVLAWGLLFAGSRGPVLGVAVVVVVACVGYWLWSLRRHRWLAVLGMPVVAVLLVAMLVEANLAGVLGEFGVAGVMRGLGSGALDQNAADRLFLYSEAASLTAANPLGIGLGVYERVGSHRYPHNIFMELAVEGGLLFAFFLVAVVLFLITRLLGELPHRRLMPSLILFGLIYSTINASLSFSLDRNEQFWFFLVLATLWVTARRVRANLIQAQRQG